MQHQTSSIVALCAFACFGCGDSAKNDSNDGPESATAADAGSSDGGSEVDAASSDVPVPDFGAIAVEPIEEDGSDAGVGVAPNLVETLDEVRQALPLLARSKLSLALMIQAHKLRDDAASERIFALVEEATKMGVPVRPVPVLSADEGYFPNATNHVAFAAVARDLARRWKARGLPETTLVVDMEPPRELTEALASLDIVKAAPNDHIDRERYAAGRQGYVALVDELHREGFKVAMTTQASLLADYRDDDDDLRQYFNVVIEGPAWDELEFQLYRSAYQQQAPGLGPHFVYDFARAAQARFPDKTVGVTLGVTHPGPVFPETQTLASPEELRKDVAAARAAGVPRERIGVYNLKGVLLGPPKCDQVLGCEASEYEYGTNDPADWLEPLSNEQPPEESAATGVLWTQLDLMDGLLDVMMAVDPSLGS